MKIGLLGGSFDPVHLGHIHIAEQAKLKLGLDEVHFIPCHIPPHKAGFKTSVEDRLAMLKLVLEPYPWLKLDERELRSESTSYTLNTLQHIRGEVGAETSLVFIVGWDSWLNLSTWYHWQELFAYANFAVFRRPTFSGKQQQDLASHTDSRLVANDELANLPFGCCTIVETDEKAVSSTEIRHAIKNGQNLGLPQVVFEYIRQNTLYS